MNRKQTPVAIFTYNRPAHGDKLFRSLSHCSGLDRCRIHIYCDGPKKIDCVADVEASRVVVRTWARRLGAEIIERDENYGLERSIVEGVTNLCKAYGRVIVVEDDFVVSPDFLDYMLQGLDRYEGEPRVYQISGYMGSAKHPHSPDAFFLPLATTRGWATWSRAWEAFEWKPSIERLDEPAVAYAFDLDGAYPYGKMLRSHLSGNMESWGILWWWAVFTVGGLVLHPRQSLVWIGGFDGSGTHCGHSQFVQDPGSDFLHARLSNPIEFPSQVLADSTAFTRVKAALRLGDNKPSGLRATFGRAMARLTGLVK